MPASYWVDKVYTSIYTINRLPTPILHNQRPFQRLFDRETDYRFLRTFGSTCFPLLPPNYFHKLQAKSVQCVVLGYASNYKGYRCLDPTVGHVYVSRHVTFMEDSFPFLTLTKSAPANLNTIIRESRELLSRPWCLTTTN